LIQEERPPVRWGVGVALAIAIAFGLVAGLYELHDPDIWWVAAAGRARLVTGAIPTTNLFSFTDPTHPWLMHEWLLAVPYAWLMQHLGPGAFALGAVIQTAVATALIARFFHDETRSVGAFLSLTIVTLALFGLRFLTLRPTHVALLLALAFSTLLFREGLDLPRTLLLVALELAWANVHGSFVVGVCLALGSVIVYPGERRARAALVGLVTLVTFINPYGPRLHRFVLEYFLGQREVYRVIHEHVEDFAPLYRLSPVDKPLTFIGFAVIVVAFVLLLRRDAGGRSPSLARAAIVGVLAIVAVLNARHLDLAGLVSMLLAAPSVDALFRNGALTSAVARSRWIPLTLASSSLVAGLGGFVWRTVEAPSRDRFVTPDGTSGASWALALDHVPAGARLFVPFSAGGIAIWYTAPRGVHVFYDPRNDCYSAAVARDAFALEYVSGGSEAAIATLERYGTTDVLVPRSHPLARAMFTSKGYSPAFATDEVVSFHRRD